VVRGVVRDEVKGEAYTRNEKKRTLPLQGRKKNEDNQSLFTEQSEGGKIRILEARSRETKGEKKETPASKRNFY